MVVTSITTTKLLPSATPTTTITHIGHSRVKCTNKLDTTGLSSIMSSCSSHKLFSHKFFDFSGLENYNVPFTMKDKM
jgi:hypothetical protein